MSEQNPQSMVEYHKKNEQSMITRSNKSQDLKCFADNGNTFNRPTHNQGLNQIEENLSHTVNSVMEDGLSLQPLKVEQNSHPTPNGETVSTPDLKKHLKDWDEVDYEFFVQQFNASSSVKEIKDLVGQQRTEKIELICSRCDLYDLQIDKEKMKRWFIENANTRSRLPIVKVCSGNYIRISDVLASRCGISLKERDEYTISVDISGDEEKLILTKLKD